MDSNSQPDMREVSRLREELEQAREELAAIQTIAAVGSWRMEFPSGRLVCSDEAYRILCIQPEEVGRGMEAVLPHIHPDDRKELLDAFDRARRHELSTRIELRVLKPDGALRHVQLRARFFHSVNGATLLRGTVHDITERAMTAERLRDSEERFAIAARATTDAVWDWDLHSGKLWWNENMGVLFGFSAEETETGIEWWSARLHPDDRERVVAGIDAAISGGGEQWSDEYRFLRKDGSYAYVLDRGYVTRDTDGKALRVIGAMVDTTELKHAEQKRLEAYARIRDQAALLDQARDAIAARGLDGRILYWNKGAERLHGWTREEMLGRTIDEVPYADPDQIRVATATVLEKGDFFGQIDERHKDGSTLIAENHWTLVNDDDGRPKSIFCIKTDITRRIAAERKIQYLAFYDALTGLPNRSLLTDRLQQALSDAARSGQRGALLLIDLDNFKALNDNFGHDKGDVLLCAVAERLKECVRETDTVARFGGDEFVVMLLHLGEELEQATERARAVGDQILAAFRAPFPLQGYGQYTATPSIGVTLFNNDADSTDDLLKRADIAMYQAKAGGRNSQRFFDPRMQALIAERMALDADLRSAILAQQFVLHYQPQVDIDGRIIGAEALIRWRHPGRGMVLPAQFIPLAEETGLILPLGEWVLHSACDQMKKWSGRLGMPHFSLAINVSASQFHKAGFTESVLAAVERCGVNPAALKFELTESLLLDNVEDTIDKMTRLKAAGVGFSLDDFGTGYSSLSYLKQLPLDQLKIDRSFVRDVLTDPNDAAIARTIVALGQSLGLFVIAEGVETEAQRDFLAEQGCLAYQGYLFSAPLPEEKFEEFIRTRVRG
jgi:diguanylate cyclase (GGDEF)-like protein/PAS domain S-box-containing protein